MMVGNNPRNHSCCPQAGDGERSDDDPSEYDRIWSIV